MTTCVRASEQENSGSGSVAQKDFSSQVLCASSAAIRRFDPVKRCSSAPPAFIDELKADVELIDLSACNGSEYECDCPVSSDSEDDDQIFPQKTVHQEWFKNKKTFEMRLEKNVRKCIRMSCANITKQQLLKETRWDVGATGLKNNITDEMQTVVQATYIVQYERFFPKMYKTLGYKQIMAKAQEHCHSRYYSYREEIHQAIVARLNEFSPKKQKTSSKQ